MSSALFGDLGCLSVDLDQFQARNRVPLFVNQWNRWILMRTTRDNPDDATILATMRAAFGKWSPKLWGPADLTIETTIPDGARAGQRTVRVGHFDYLHIIQARRSQITFPREQWAKLMPEQRLPARRESVDPVPTLSTSTAIWLEVAFVWRGQGETSRPWPVLTDSVVRATQQCPIDADWILDSCAIPAAEPAPKEKTPLEKGGTEIDLMIPPVTWGAGLFAAGAAAALLGLFLARR
jgi:hypothetical protein